MVKDFRQGIVGHVNNDKYSVLIQKLVYFPRQRPQSLPWARSALWLLLLGCNVKLCWYWQLTCLSFDLKFKNISVFPPTFSFCYLLLFVFVFRFCVVF